MQGPHYSVQYNTIINLDWSVHTILILAVHFSLGIKLKMTKKYLVLKHPVRTKQRSEARWFNNEWEMTIILHLLWQNYRNMSAIHSVINVISKYLPNDTWQCWIFISYGWLQLNQLDFQSSLNILGKTSIFPQVYFCDLDVICSSSTILMTCNKS